MCLKYLKKVNDQIRLHRGHKIHSRRDKTDSRRPNIGNRNQRHDHDGCSDDRRRSCDTAV